MTKIIFTFALSSIVIIANAQFSYAIKGGLNVANVHSNQSVNRNWKPSYHIGLSMDYSFTKKLYVSGDLLYSNKGFVGSSTNISLSYISAPLVIGYAILSKLSAEAGVGLNYLVYSDESDLWGNKFDAGLQAGFRYRLSPRIKLSLRYEHGLSNVLSKDAVIYFPNAQGSADPQKIRDLGFKDQNRNFQLSVSYVFNNHK